MTSQGLDIEQSHSGEICVVTLSGRIDNSNSGELMRRLDTLISSGQRNILLDFAAVLYLTSAAFRALLVATDAAERSAGRVALCSVIGHVRELFEMGGLLDAFTILGSREEALARLG
jgi:anti-anti-sigma factor